MFPDEVSQRGLSLPRGEVSSRLPRSGLYSRQMVLRR